MTPNHSTAKSWFDMTYEERWSTSSLEMVCEVWKLDPSKAAPDLLKLKERLVDLKHYHLNHPLELARCYYDANTKLKSAEDKFRKMVSWRQQEGIDDLLSDDKQHEPPALMEEYYPSCYLEGYDKEGDPIWIDRTGSSDAWAVYSRYGHVAFRNYILRNREMALRGEYARQYEQRCGKPPARVTVIMDMEGLCRRHLNRGLIAPLEEGIRQLQDYYGGMAKRILVTNAPWVFRLVWSIAQHFCNESLKKSIIFCNAKNTQETLDLYIERQVLPPAFCPQWGQGRPGLGYAQTTLEGGIMEDEDSMMMMQPPELKTAGSNETVASCDSATIGMDSSSLPSPPASPRHSSTSFSNSTNEDSATAVQVQVKTTCLLSGFLLLPPLQEGGNNNNNNKCRVLLEF